jgi:hypothetical protein
MKGMFAQKGVVFPEFQALFCVHFVLGSGIDTARVFRANQSDDFPVFAFFRHIRFPSLTSSSESCRSVSGISPRDRPNPPIFASL